MARWPEPDARAATARPLGPRGDRRVTHVLFYGTLCRGEANHRLLRLEAALTYRGKRSVGGTLYDLGSYPGLLLGTGRAAAELFRIDDASVLRRLDRFERYEPRNPERSLFRRTRVAIPRFANSASTIDAWIYAFNGLVEGRPVIETGSWREHREHAGRAP
jgi:gamma-glutamylcyclotransferase (GGCT)/AIG2-like uncharacterized protein YtfP